MLVVYTGETGGTLTFEIPSGVLQVAVSGHATVVSPGRIKTTVTGLVSGEYLVINKSELSSSLSPGQHTILPKVTDTENKVYFLLQDDLRIIGVP